MALETLARLWHSGFVNVVLCRTRCLGRACGASYCSLLYELKEQGLGDFFNLPRAERFLEKVVRYPYAPAFLLFLPPTPLPVAELSPAAVDAVLDA